MVIVIIIADYDYCNDDYALGCFQPVRFLAEVT